MEATVTLSLKEYEELIKFKKDTLEKLENEVVLYCDYASDYRGFLLKRRKSLPLII
jgi:hypothetical protein